VTILVVIPLANIQVEGSCGTGYDPLGDTGNLGLVLGDIVFEEGKIVGFGFKGYDFGTTTGCETTKCTYKDQVVSERSE
jgi:hypothetical protein